MDLNAVLIIVVSSVAAVMACAKLTGRERALALTAFLLHVVAAFCQVWVQVVYYEGCSDAAEYQRAGQSIAKFLDYDFWGFAPEVPKLFFHLQTTTSFEFFGEGNSTGTAAAVAGAFSYVAGPSLLDLCLVTTWISWFGLMCWYRVAREELPEKEHKAAMIGLLFVPSALFWGSVFAKESVTMGAFGLLGLSVYRLVRSKNPLYIAGIAIGVLTVAMLKPYTLVPFVFALSVFVYVSRASTSGARLRFRPLHSLVAVVMALSGVAAMGAAFPEYSAENISHTISTQQDAWDEDSGGSSIARVGGNSTGIVEQVELVPLALVNSFFRPTVFEARGAPALGASLETALLLLAVLTLLDGKGAVVRTIASTPLLAASTVFIFVFAIAVGLTTSNLGSLSRYRVPMLPFCAFVLLVVHQRRREAIGAATRKTRPLLGIHRRTS